MNDSFLQGLLAAGTALTSFALTRLLISMAPRLRLIDAPNARSSHTRPTPRGGGLALVAAFSLGVLLAVALGFVVLRDALTLLVPAGAVAAVGFVDDLRGVRPPVRLAVHLGAAGLFLAAIGGLPATGLRWLDDSPALGFVIGLLAIAWSINFFNFMDGIDGIAASEALFVGLAMAGVAAAVGQANLLAISLGFSAAVVGFLAWNWPPARIFMGDVGSGFLGFVLAAMGLLELEAAKFSVWVLVLLPGLFLADATVTLVRRAMRSERVHEAHRSHAYQWLARRWGSHLKVTGAYIALNLLVVLPAAIVAFRNPSVAGWLAASVVLTLGLLAAVSGAGREERPPR